MLMVRWMKGEWIWIELLDVIVLPINLKCSRITRLTIIPGYPEVSSDE